MYYICKLQYNLSFIKVTYWFMLHMFHLILLSIFFYGACAKNPIYITTEYKYLNLP
jgi:hypothetical protein